MVNHLLVVAVVAVVAHHLRAEKRVLVVQAYSYSNTQQHNQID
jgi:hypothetical protein